MVGDRQAKLCWSQRHIWLNHHSLPEAARHEYNIVLHYTPPQGASAETLQLSLDYLVRRHEVLRTTYQPTGDDGPTQRVAPPQSLPVLRYETGVDGDQPADTISDLARTAFRLEQEWPIRGCMVITDGAPRLLVLVVHHIALDDWSIERLHRELESVHGAILANRPGALPEIQRQPVDLARFEATDAQQRLTGQNALRHWEQALSASPSDLFRSRRDRGGTSGHTSGSTPGGALSAALSSVAALTAARRLAARYRVWPPAVYTAIFNTLLYAYTESQTILFRDYAANRRTDWQAESMSCMFQPAAVATRLDSALPFSEVVRRSAQAREEAHANAYCAYDEVVELSSRLGSERGEPLRQGAFFNYLKYAPESYGVQRSTFTWKAEPVTWSLLGQDLYFRIYEYRDALVATLSASTEVMTAPNVERFLRGFEELLAAQAEAEQEPLLGDLAASAGFLPRPPDQSPIAETASVVKGYAPWSAPRTPAEDALSDAVREANGLKPCSMADSYVAVGGRALNAPQVQELLRLNGWSGVGIRDLLSPTPLRTVAARLSPVSEE